ncbi:MAG TPA: hypothetical protein VF765_24605 [Polyangiaceae bacterium]
MLEDLVRVGTPSFFPYVATISGGNGGPCSQGVIDGVVNNRHKFLPFVAGGINWVASQGQDVISAHFSGCIMAAYTEGGVAKVCHVSTGATFGDCLGAWDIIKARSTNVFQFRPSDFIDNTVHSKCYGLITADLQVYTILTNPKTMAHPKGGSLRSDEQFVKIVKAHLLR